MKRVMPLYKKDGVNGVFLLPSLPAFCFGLTMFGGISIGVLFFFFTSRLVQSILLFLPFRSFFALVILLSFQHFV